MKSKALLIGLLAAGVADWLLLNLVAGPAYLASIEPLPAGWPATAAALASPLDNAAATPSPRPRPTPDPRPDGSQDTVMPPTTPDAAAPASAGVPSPVEPPTASDTAPAPNLQPLLFRRHSAELSPEARESLLRLGAYLRKQPDAKARVAGHTDARGREQLNDWLSMQRALAVKAYLCTLGARRHQVQVEAFGARRPLDASDSEAADAKNRRVEVTIVGTKP